MGGAFDRAWEVMKAGPPIRHPTDPQQGWFCPKCGGDAEPIMKNAPSKSGYNEYMLFGFECVGKKDYALADDYQDRDDSSIWHTIAAPSLINPCGWRFLLDEPLEDLGEYE